MDITLKGDKLHIIIDVSEEARNLAPVSSTGKTKIVATTHGFSNYGPVGLNLTVTSRLPKQAA